MDQGGTGGMRSLCRTLSCVSVGGESEAEMGPDVVWRWNFAI